MAKRLNRADFVLTYMIILSFACLVSGFFLGAWYMKSNLQVELERVEQALKLSLDQDELLKEKKIYKEQDFTSFYHMILTPLDQFKQEHFRYVSKLQDQSRPEQVKISSEMRKVVQETIKQVEKGIIPSNSPLLLQARHEYLKSLEAYTEGIENVLDSNNLSALNAQDIASEKHLETFHSDWLKAQVSLYKAIAVWEAMYVTEQDLPEKLPESLTIDQWKAYPFHYRDYIAAELIQKSNRLAEYNPEDLTAKLDSIIMNEQADTLGWSDIPFAVRALQTTNAIRPGDYKVMRNQLYSQLASPEIPLFK